MLKNTIFASFSLLTFTFTSYDSETTTVNVATAVKDGLSSSIAFTRTLYVPAFTPSLVYTVAELPSSSSSLKAPPKVSNNSNLYDPEPPLTRKYSLIL